MRNYLFKAIQKINKLSPEQIRLLIQEISLENSSFKTLLSSLPDGIIACSKNYQPWYINRSAQYLLGMQKINTQAPIWQQTAYTSIKNLLYQAFLKKQNIQDEPIAVNEHILSLTIDPLAGNGRISGWLILARDMTQVHQQTPLRRGDESLAKLANMTAILAHEIRNPLTAISIHLQLIKTYQTQPHTEQDIQECLDIIQEEVQHLNAVTSHFLSMARPVKVYPQAKDLKIILQKTTALMRPEIETAKVCFQLVLPNHPIVVMVDEELLHMALVNLLRNALGAITEPGGKIELSLTEDKSYARIAVCDNGTGIPLNKQNKIFEPYYTTKENGTGLGLTLVYKVVREHGGTIAVTSPVSPSHKGSKFTISLPKQSENHPKLTFQSS